MHGRQDEREGTSTKFPFDRRGVGGLEAPERGTAQFPKHGSNRLFVDRMRYLYGCAVPFVPARAWAAVSFNVIRLFDYRTVSEGCYITLWWACTLYVCTDVEM